MLGLAGWFAWTIAVALFLVIAFTGLSFLRGIFSARPTEGTPPEDVADLDVFLVCGECGTEYQVTRLGEIQVPRHCGEPMNVIRRPRQQPLAN